MNASEVIGRTLTEVQRNDDFAEAVGLALRKQQLPYKLHSFPKKCLWDLPELVGRLLLPQSMAPASASKAFRLRHESAQASRVGGAVIGVQRNDYLAEAVGLALRKQQLPYKLHSFPKKMFVGLTGACRAFAASAKHGACFRK